VAKLLPTARAVEFRRFVEVRRDGLQADENEHDIESDVFPRRHQSNRGHRDARVGEPTNFRRA
jgi:hypothetical protein